VTHPFGQTRSSRMRLRLRCIAVVALAASGPIARVITPRSDASRPVRPDDARLPTAELALGSGCSGGV
ncbi:MAG: hypothetical protein ABW321_16795, partial [Polyangiales bacterium]